MATQHRQAAGSTAQQVAARRLPGRAHEIRHLIERDESFAGLCDDLAAADSALQGIDRVPEALRAARRSEYEDIVAGLTAEIQQALRRAKVFPIAEAKRRHGP